MDIRWCQIIFSLVETFVSTFFLREVHNLDQHTLVSSMWCTFIGWDLFTYCI